MKRRSLEDYQRDKRLKLATADGVTLSNTMTIDDRIERINQCWKKTNEDYVAGIIEVGQELIEAQQEHGKSLRKMAEKLPFDWSTAHQLMVIARRLCTSGTHSALPPSWRTLYELAQLPEHVMQAALEDGRINPNMTRAEAKVLKPAKSRKTKPSNSENGGKIDKAIELVREKVDAGESVQSKELGKPYGISHNTIETAVHVVRKIDEAKKQWLREKPTERLLTLEELCAQTAAQWHGESKDQRLRIISKFMKALDVNIHDWTIGTFSLGKRRK